MAKKLSPEEQVRLMRERKSHGVDPVKSPYGYVNLSGKDIMPLRNATKEEKMTMKAGRRRRGGTLGELLVGRKLKPEERNLTRTKKAVQASAAHPFLKKGGRSRRHKTHRRRR